ncbi:MAG: Gfo/Idh/MocA family oxidoreductase [Limnochordia bacterium]|jgi:predicted dehydrogenase|nr:Gfo/Idh/MocA family oxidoreductase [Limnochordia bacterium]MDI9464401.1 Gfo/Idh/MocA family oxidoreductase [Bacillota bacterium]NLO95101.1 Gfo/Idh/MocA family oxidoreductase [Bacillota bacterium]HAN94335.1 hypothetical protein [Bacillota bacterium]HOB41074.1 Gfo/Idh/MocA family oxidoreductase [Limnochordia bacterium]
MERVGIGILGSGFMAQTHAKALAERPDAEIRWICGRNPQKVNDLAAQVGARGTTDLGQLLADPLVDAVVVCYPTGLHKEMTIQALEAGKKVLCEKPIALTLEDAEAMLQAAAAAARHAGVSEPDPQRLAAHFLMIGHVLRFWPEYERVLELKEEGKLGEIRAVELERLSTSPQWASWFADLSLSGGMVVDLMVHDFDMACALLGVPESVSAWGVPVPGGDWKHVHVVITFTGGQRAHVVGSHLMPPSYPFTSFLRVLGQKAAAEYRFVAGGGSVTDEGGAPNRLVLYGEEELQPEVAGFGEDPYARQLAYFLEWVRRGGAVERGTPSQAKTAVAIALAAREALASGCSVELGGLL